MNDDMPAPKSSSANRQPSCCSSFIRRTALGRCDMALVSVISKHSSAGFSPDSVSAVRMNLSRLSSPRLVPDRLMAQVCSGRAPGVRR
ncbi:hypothetical protein D3C71_1934440 [compost metagenome]